MKHLRYLAPLNLLLMAVIGVLLVNPVGAVGDDAATEDVLYMNDGRELHGQILEERRDAIVFQLEHSGIRTKITYMLDEIARIDRDVAIKPEGDATEREAKTRGSTNRSRGGATSRPDDDEDENETSYGSHRSDAVNENATSFYIVPMKGQMGTDVTSQVYEDIVEDIREANPDILVIKMDCKDEENMLYSLIGPQEQGMADFDDFRKMANMFKDDLRDIRQVMWVEDSLGVSSVMAMLWDELYMSPEARFGGLVKLQEIGFEKWDDDDVRGKMTAAFMSWIEGFLIYGGYDVSLAHAMVRPKFSLSGSWKGRDVVWGLDTDGEYVVDHSDKRTAEFDAKSAEDLCISDGTVESLDDLALLLGYREYRVLEGRGEDLFEKYTDNWRRALENCGTWYRDYEQFLGWANGDDTLKYLGQAKGRLEKILAAMERYKAVEVRLARDYGLRKFDLITTIEVLKERIRAMRRNGRGGAGGGFGGGG